MRRTRTRQAEPSVPLSDLLEELERSRVYQCSLRSPIEQLHGFVEADSHIIYIDPRLAILDTLIHELLHRRKPKWGERRVERETRRLVGRMDDATKARWWRAYNRIKRQRRPVDVE
jgi:hypothetical protein